jgi:uncharacterized protein (TIGR02117 family)
MNRILGAFLIFISGCSFQPDTVDYNRHFEGTGGQSIYVVSHGWHTGFVIPAHAIYAQLPSLQQRFNGAPYIEFGWGDKSFYQSKEVSLATSLSAILWPTDAVMHVAGVPASVSEYFKNSRTEILCLNDEELHNLVVFITNSFARTTDRGLIMLNGGLYGDSQFYEGTGDYFLFNTCNKWTAKGLQSIGMDIQPMTILRADSIMDYLSDHKAATAGHDDTPRKTATGC